MICFDQKLLHLLRLQCWWYRMHSYCSYYVAGCNNHHIREVLQNIYICLFVCFHWIQSPFDNNLSCYLKQNHYLRIFTANQSVLLQESFNTKHALTIKKPSASKSCQETSIKYTKVSKQFCLNHMLSSWGKHDAPLHGFTHPNNVAIETHWDVISLVLTKVISDCIKDLPTSTTCHRTCS